MTLLLNQRLRRFQGQIEAPLQRQALGIEALDVVQPPAAGSR
jgi:hypothetical protein